jgi:excisionase family DNA binding protein
MGAARNILKESNMQVSNTLSPVTTRERVTAASVGKFYSIGEVAELLGVSTRTVRRAIERKDLVAHKLGRPVRIAEADLKIFIARHRCL